MPDGVINLNKPAGMTSHDCVSLVRRLLSTRRVGHTGTLDPDATGVLPICVGHATKAADLLTASDKRYRAVLKLGITTDTADLSGTVLSEKPVVASPEEITAAVMSFVGSYDQVPPMYSAIKKNGKKLYELARQGITIEREPRRITVFDITITDMTRDTVTMDVFCSKGTYIRTLCEDIGNKLGCGGAMQQLTRTASGKWFSIEDALTPEQLKIAADEARLSEVLTPVDTFFTEYPALTLDAVQSMRVKNGVPIYFDGTVGDTFRVYDENGVFLALSRIVLAERTQLKLWKSFY